MFKEIKEKANRLMFKVKVEFNARVLGYRYRSTGIWYSHKQGKVIQPEAGEMAIYHTFDKNGNIVGQTIYAKNV